MAQVWYTQLKGNRPEDSGPIECEEFKEVFLDKYFSREMRSLSFSSNQHDVEECSMKFSKLSKYATCVKSKGWNYPLCDQGRRLSNGRMTYNDDT